MRAAVERGKQSVRAQPTRSWPSWRRSSTARFYELLEPGAWLESKVSEGGTSLARVRDQLAQARHVLEEARA